MILSNFRPHESKKDFAYVDVTTGRWWWKRTVTRIIYRPYGGYHWYFVDNGEFTPNYKAETLANAYEAKKKLEAK